MPSTISSGSIESEGLYFIVAFRTNDFRRLRFITPENEFTDDPRDARIRKHSLTSFTRSVVIPDNQRIQYDGTSISDLVYISIEQICFVSAIRLNKTGANLYNYIVEPNYYGYYNEQPNLLNSLTPDNMKFQISRAFISINTPNEGNLSNSQGSETITLNNYRTLKFNPFPEPVIVDTGSEPALAYELGAPCPPKWNPGRLIWGLDARFVTIDEQYIPMSPRPNPYEMSRWERIRNNSLFPALVTTIAALVIVSALLITQFFNTMSIK
jgi:hypothetical protein